MFSVVVSLFALLVAVVALVRACIDHYSYKKRVRDLQRRTFDAQRSLKGLGDLANEVAHEIKNPITAILCSAETLDLLIGEKLDEVNRKSLRYIKDYGDNLLKLVGDFLDLSRVQTGKIESKPKVVEIASHVESIIGLLESSANKKKILVKPFIGNTRLKGLVDPNHFKQVLFNILHNAIKFTPQEGEIHVIVKHDFPNPFVRVSVKDNGRGIPEEQLDSLFNPYVKYDGQIDDLEAGAGIGLSLCKTYIELAGGTISVKSTPGLGSSFTFTVPQYREEVDPYELSEEDLEDTRKTFNQPLSGQSFLIVDEDLGSRESVSRLIEAWGGMVDKVTMAIDVIEALENKAYDAVMIDDTKDGVYGYELAKMIKEELKIQNTTVIMTTRNPIDPDLARESKADKCIEKPLNGRVLLRSLLKSGKYTITH